MDPLGGFYISLFLSAQMHIFFFDGLKIRLNSLKDFNEKPSCCQFVRDGEAGQQGSEHVSALIRFTEPEEFTQFQMVEKNVISIG